MMEELDDEWFTYTGGYGEGQGMSGARVVLVGATGVIGGLVFRYALSVDFSAAFALALFSASPKGEEAGSLSHHLSNVFVNSSNQLKTTRRSGRNRGIPCSSTTTRNLRPSGVTSYPFP